MEKRTFSELIEDITEVLSEYDGESLAELAGTILAKEIEYTEDSLFEIKEDVAW